MGFAICYILIYFCIHTLDSQYPVTFPGHEASLGNMKGQTHCFQAVQRSSEHMFGAQFLEENMQRSVLVLCLVCKIYYRSMSYTIKSNVPLTRNPPLGLVTSVVPMVMFSLTSRKLGTVVFSKRNMDE